jgi:hypothetical protein
MTFKRVVETCTQANQSQTEKHLQILRLRKAWIFCYSPKPENKGQSQEVFFMQKASLLLSSSAFPKTFHSSKFVYGILNLFFILLLNNGGNRVVCLFAWQLKKSIIMSGVGK